MTELKNEYKIKFKKVPLSFFACRAIRRSFGLPKRGCCDFCDVEKRIFDILEAGCGASQNFDFVLKIELEGMQSLRKHLPDIARRLFAVLLFAKHSRYSRHISLIIDGVPSPSAE